MAKVMAKSGLAGKVGTAGKKAVQEHRNDETEFDSSARLPAGIEGGVAQLIDCRFSQYDKGDNKGEYFFYAAGTVVEPKQYAGMRTSIIEPIHDTPTRSRATIADHLAWVMNEMRKLGADTKDVEVEQLEELAASLVEEAPHFRFRTWASAPNKQYPNPRTNEVWNGLVAFDGDTTEGGVVDDSGTDQTGEQAEQEQEIDLAALGEAADSQDPEEESEEKAQLSELAEQSGINPDDYETWAELAAVLSEAGGEEGSGDEGAADDKPAEPQVDEVWSYTPPRKTKRDVNVQKVYTRLKQADVLDLVDNKTVYPKVPFDKLS